jgi:lipoate-protein ligase A
MYSYITIEEFKKLSVPEKNEKMISHFKARLGRKVESGKLDQNKANELLAEFTEKINQWDGTGMADLVTSSAVASAI